MSYDTPLKFEVPFAPIPSRALNILMVQPVPPLYVLCAIESGHPLRLRASHYECIRGSYRYLEAILGC